MSFRSFVAGLFVIAGAARAQSPAQHIALGDSMYAQFKPDEALPHYLEICFRKCSTGIACRRAKYQRPGFYLEDRK